MKIKFMNGGVSLGNIIVIIVLLAGLIGSWAVFGEKVSAMEVQIEKKASKETVDLQYEFIQQQLKDIKGLLNKP